MFVSPFLLISDTPGVIYLFIILLFFTPTLFVFWHFLKGKLNKAKFIGEFIELAAFVIKSDEHVASKEKEFVYYFLEKQFGKKHLTKYKQQLNAFLKSKKTVYHTLKNIDENQDPKTKIQLLHFLVKIAIIDGYLTNSELATLTKISRGIGLKPARLTSILAMHSFVTEQQHEKNTNKNRSRIRKSNSKLDDAYRILELKNSATHKEIKKSYRKLVALYHPDKLFKLSPLQKEASKELFFKINEAYELLKAEKGFK